MPHLVAAPDKFRGTASAGEVARAMVATALAAGWTADPVPMSDGGEGLLEAVRGHPQETVVPGPLGAPTRAEWRLLPARGRAGPTAVIEMSRAAGRALLPHPAGDDPLEADTSGVGVLLLAARDAGARHIVIGCGGSATTDGGWGAVQAVGGPDALAGLDLVVASDVTTPFRQAAAVFGPQKGATPAQVALLSSRLDALADRYRQSFGCDVDALAGAGAAGGLAGGLAVLGARIRPGFELVSELVGLADRLAGADLVMTGEGHLDDTSFLGKVPGGVIELTAGRCPVVCVVGGADRHLLVSAPPGVHIVSLTARYGQRRARAETTTLIGEATSEALGRFCP
jgi:glycerate kinase